MGIELHYTFNLFTSLLKRICASRTKILNSQGFWVSWNNKLLKVGIRTGFNWLQESMDRLLEQYSRESIRNTMLRHEEIFKQQVHELHRLYRVQKILMAESRSKEVKLNSHTPATIPDARIRVCNSMSTSETSHSLHISNRHHSTTQLNPEYSSLHGSSTTEGPSSRELSICFEDPSRMQKGFDLELHAQEGTSTGVEAIQDQMVVLQKQSKEAISTEGPHLWADGESDVELTLSIGCGSDRKNSKHWLDPSIGSGCAKSSPSETRQLLMSVPVRAERGEECSDPSTGFDRESLQRPGWLFRALSLNRT